VPRPATQSLAFGTVRWFFELDACLAGLLERPGAKQDAELRALLLVGLFQLRHGATPAHAAVSETVEAARALGHARAAGLVNAILRRFQREGDAIVAAAHRGRAARHAHPEWMVDAFARDWPDRWESIAAAGNAEPPMWLRVNARRAATGAYLARLSDAGIKATASAFAPEALRLDEPADVHSLPGFADGDVSVQDAAAQLAPRFLGATAGMRVLDACAAPGGKACHALELEPAIAELVALDVDSARASRIESNLSRLGLKASVVVANAARPADWWDRRPFERILLDVPCSGTGVIRRHPDIKLLRRPTDLEAFATTQRQVLRTAFELLRPGGRLIYCTCSVLPDENQHVVAAFLAGEPRAAVGAWPDGLKPPPGLIERSVGWQLLPGGDAGTDGFYYACIHKLTT